MRELTLIEQRHHEKVLAAIQAARDYFNSLPPEKQKMEARRRLLAAGIYVEKDGELVLAPQYGGPGWDDPEHANNYTQLIGLHPNV